MQICGSALDSENLLLCDSEGCDVAYHLGCLRVPLSAVPEGEWFCERCDERHKVGGDLEVARALLPNGAGRWKLRAMGIRCCAQLALAVGSFERALRLDDLSSGIARVRKGQRGQRVYQSGPLLTQRRTGENGHYEFLAVDEPQPEKMTITVPVGVSAGDKIRCTAATCAAFIVVVPAGVIPGQLLHAEIPLSTSSKGTAQWQMLEALETPDRMCKVMEFELVEEKKLRREERDREEIRSMVSQLILVLERAEQSEINRAQRMQQWQQVQQLPRTDNDQVPAEVREHRKKRRREVDEQSSSPHLLQSLPAQQKHSQHPSPSIHYQQCQQPQQDQLQYVMATPCNNQNTEEQQRAHQWQHQPLPPQQHSDPFQHQLLQQQQQQQQQQQLHMQHLQVQQQVQQLQQFQVSDAVESAACVFFSPATLY